MDLKYPGEGRVTRGCKGGTPCSWVSRWMLFIHRRAVTQHHHPVRQADGLGDIMGHQQRRLALLPYDAVDIRRYGSLV